MKRFTVGKGVYGVLIKSGQPGDRASVSAYVTTRESVFSESEVVIDPQARFGSHTCASRTVGGDYARKDYMGFHRAGVEAVLIVPAASIMESEDNPAE